MRRTYRLLYVDNPNLKNDWNHLTGYKPRRILYSHANEKMECIVREWKIEDASVLAEMLNNKNILNNLCDGLPYPYTKKDAEEYIMSMLSANKTKTFTFAITVDDKVVGSIGVFQCENIRFRTAEMGYYNLRDF